MVIPSKPATVFSRAGEFFGAVDTSYRSEFSSSPSASRYMVVDGYGLINARAGFRWSDGWSVFLWSRNLLDKNYFEFLTAQPGNSGLYVGLPGDPRTIGLTVRMNLRSDPLTRLHSRGLTGYFEFRNSSVASRARLRYDRRAEP